MLCKKADKTLLKDENYLFQPKLDGTRALYHDKNHLINRRGRNIIHRYPEFQNLEIEEGCIIDGEVIVYNEEGLPDFHLLQSREQTGKDYKIEYLSKQHPATFVVFDCLLYHGEEFTSQPIEKRLKRLKEAVTEGEYLQVIFTTEQGEELWEKITDLDIEGVIAKKKGSKYEAGKRSALWLKIKNLKTVDCVIQGFTWGEGKREDTFGALYLGVYRDGKLVNVGKVGTGWTEEELKALREKMDEYRIKVTEEKVLLEPTLVCEVEYLEKTKRGDLRAPSFKRLRFDKKPKQCTWEQLTRA